MADIHRRRSSFVPASWWAYQLISEWRDRPLLATKIKEKAAEKKSSSHGDGTQIADRVSGEPNYRLNGSDVSPTK